MKNILVLVFAAICFNLFGQAVDTIVIEEVEVVASRLALTQKELSKSSTIVKPIDFENQPIRSLDDILRYLPGVELQSRNAFGVQSDITMRGSNFNQVLVLIDGVRQNDPLTGHFNGNLPVLLDDIEQIEVIRGPATAMYGPDAVGGVINVVTKKGPLENKVAIAADLAGGQFGYLSANGMVTAQLGKFTPFVGFNFQKSDGQDIDSSDLKTFFNLKTYSFGLGFQPSDKVKMKFRSSIDERNFNAQWFYTRSSFDRSRERVKQFDNQLNVEIDHSKNARTLLLLSHQMTQDSFIFNPLFSPNIHTTSLTDAQVIHQRTIGDLKFSGGFQGDKRKIESTDRGDHDDFHFGAFAAGHYSIESGLNISGSLRFDNDANFGTQISPQLGLSFLTSNVKFRATVGRSVRAADYTERYVSHNIPGILSSGRNLGNPDLLAESSWSYEAGADIYANEQLTIAATGFYRIGKNLIDFIFTPSTEIPRNEKLAPDGSYFFPLNVSEINTYGLEILPTWQGRISNSVGLRYQTGVTLMKSNIPGSDELASKYLANHSKLSWQQNIGLTIGQFNLGVQTHYKSRDADAVAAIGAELKANYFVVNAKASYELKGLNFYVQGLNLTNTKYRDILGAQMPRQWFVGGIRVHLDAK